MVITRLTEDTGIEFPIICGAMYPCSNPELVAAASEGGGIAVLQPVSLTMVHGFDKPNRKEGLLNQHLMTGILTIIVFINPVTVTFTVVFGAASKICNDSCCQQCVHYSKSSQFHS